MLILYKKYETFKTLNVTEIKTIIGICLLILIAIIIIIWMLKYKITFCKHDWEKISFRDEYDYDIRYTIRTYKCTKCGKQIEVDGRFDNINR